MFRLTLIWALQVSMKPYNEDLNFSEGIVSIYGMHRKAANVT